MIATILDDIADRFLPDISETDREAALCVKAFNLICLSVMAFLVLTGGGLVLFLTGDAGAHLLILTISILLFGAVWVARKRSVRMGGALLTLGLWGCCRSRPGALRRRQLTIRVHIHLNYRCSGSSARPALRGSGGLAHRRLHSRRRVLAKPGLQSAELPSHAPMVDLGAAAVSDSPDTGRHKRRNASFFNRVKEGP